MYGLVFTDPGGNRVREIAVVDRVVTVGRAADVEVALPFKAVSRYHARFYSDGLALYVEDLGSANGVLVGGLRIDGPTALLPGHQVRIGVIDVAVVDPSASYPVEEPAPGFEEVPTDPRLAQSPPYQPPGQPYSAAASPFDPAAGYPSAQPGPALGYEPAAQPGYGHPAQIGYDPTAELAYGQPAEGGYGAAPPADPAMEQAPATVPGMIVGAEPETSPEAPTVALPVVPRLVGASGYLKDRIFYVDSPEFTIGRVKGCSVVVEDASISRKHAKIISKGGSFVLFDLRSFNGTQVNGEKTTRHELRGGESIRFGDIAFTFLLDDQPAVTDRGKPRRASRRRRLLLLGSAAVLLAFLVLAANILRGREEPEPPPDPHAETRAREARVRQQVEQGSTEMRRRSWDSAEATLLGVLKLDPLNQEAVRGIERAQKERERQGWIEESDRIIGAGRDLDRARSLLAKVPEESTYYAESRVTLRQLERTMAEEARSRGLSLCRAWRYEECQQELCRFFQTWPAGEPIPDEVRIRRALEQAESRLVRRQRDEFRPCAIPESGTGDPAADRLLAGRYDESRIRRAVVAYYQGRAEDGVRALGALEKNRDLAAERETIGRLIEQMIRVQTASADVHREVRGGSLPAAERSFEAMKRAEQRIVPDELQSRYVKEASKLLGDAYQSQGEEHVRSGRLRDAYQSWARGKGHAPAHPGILQSLLTLEARGREACQAAQERAQAGDIAGATSHFELCRDVTPPSSPLHQGAVESLRLLGP